MQGTLRFGSVKRIRDKSYRSSIATISASTFSPLASSTLSVLLPLATWRLVRIRPSLVTKNPVPLHPVTSASGAGSGALPDPGARGRPIGGGRIVNPADAGPVMLYWDASRLAASRVDFIFGSVRKSDGAIASAVTRFSTTS